jgi:uncharacterized protein YkwD
MTRRQRAAGRVLVLALVLGVLAPLTNEVAEASPGSAEQRFVEHINRERQNRGLGALQVNAGLRSVARVWSSTMSSQNRLYHNPNLSRQVSGKTDGQWTRLAENVGRTRLTGAGWTQLADRLHAALMSSSGHRGNILGAFNQVGVGVTVASDGSMWVTQVFMHGSATNLVSASNSPSSSTVPISGDWNGDGRVTAGWFDRGQVYLRNSHGSGRPDVSFAYGRAGDVPVVGDWNGDGKDTIGIIRGRYWHLRYSNSAGPANASFVYGRLTDGDHALAGDWNGDGKDTPGIVRNGQWHLRNALAGGKPDHSFVYGRVRSGDVPVVGDWTNDGYDTPAIIRNGGWYLRLRNAGGPADRVFSYGTSRDTPVVGDWNANGRTTPGVVRGTTWHLRNHNSSGGADSSYAF